MFAFLTFFLFYIPAFLFILLKIIITCAWFGFDLFILFNSLVFFYWYFNSDQRWDVLILFANDSVWPWRIPSVDWGKKDQHVWQFIIEVHVYSCSQGFLQHKPATVKSAWITKNVKNDPKKSMRRWKWIAACSETIS